MNKSEKPKEENELITTHHEARRDYFVLEAVETGIVLVGCEVKSLREKKANLAGSFARVEAGEVYLHAAYIAPYEQGNRENPDPLRKRKLLLRRSEIRKLEIKTAEKGLVLIPLKLYFKHGLAKVELAVCKAKKLYDKRSDIKKRSAQRDMDRAIKNRNRK